MRRTKRNTDIIRQLFGMILGLGGVVLLVHTIPIEAWYIILAGLIVVLFLLILIN